MDRKPLSGKFAWFELVSKDAKKAQAFYAEVLRWRAEGFPMGTYTYEMIYSGDTMIGGYAAPKNDRQASHWISYVSVDDVDRAAKIAVENGGKIVEAPSDIPTVGRKARIADPQGAEICLFKSQTGDPPDVENTPVGQFFWNELHTTDPKGALSFYEKVVGYTHSAMESPAGTYYVLNSPNGAGRAGVTDHLPKGTAPHWLPYVVSDDVDATAARAKGSGGSIHFGPEDIPGIGRFAVLQDPTGAFLAVMKPLPREKMRTPGA
jgi:predicted enzyme related to lactoylglutathione lyase